ncbi:site-specific integrase [Litchfieldella xinjiangensis]|uniref:site-specific integrase n=1 Tax=Litchfieldella xinjiangensis TaxID=1166948 RepID=UPI0009DF86AC|nr:site-specific integrase [Halomonas xinjiangensis]
MVGLTKLKLTEKVLKNLLKENSTGDVWDTELSGFHVRPGRTGVSFRLHYRTKTGKRRVLTIGQYGQLTCAEGRDLAKEALAVIAQGGDPVGLLVEARVEAKRQQAQTLRAYLEGPYSAYQKRKKDGNGTLRRIQKDFSTWLDRSMGSLNRADVEKWQTAQEAREEPRSFETMKRSYDALHAMLVHAAERKVIDSNPLKNIKLQRPALNYDELAEQSSQRRFLSDEEVRNLFSGIEQYQELKRAERKRSRSHGKGYLPSLDDVDFTDHVKPWLLVMYYTGFRPGDIAGLRWEHIDFERGIVRKIIEKTAHHNPAPMTFPLSHPAIDILARWHKQTHEPSIGYVFPSHRTGKRMDRTAMQKPWEKIRAIAGLPDDLLMYSLRHNFASQLVMGGVDLLTVSKLMAHRDIQTTVRYYAHLCPDHARDAVELLANKVGRLVSTG